MALCVDCGSKFSNKRKQIGYVCCLKCGEKAAKKATETMQLRVFPAGNKQAYTLLSQDRSLALREVGYPLRK